MCIPAGQFHWEKYLSTFTARELDILFSLFCIDPWGDEREDMRQRAFLQDLFNTWNGDVPARFMDYLPIHDIEAQTVEDTIENVRNLIWAPINATRAT